MATQVTEVKLNHKKFRALLKKTRRKKIRQKEARERDRLRAEQDAAAERSPGFQERAAEERRQRMLQEEYDERERQREHRLWLEREEVAQEEFRRRKAEEEECSRRKREAQEALEAAEATRRNGVSKEHADRVKKEESLKDALAKLPEGNATWHNPPAPSNYAPAVEREACSFFVKTGACRFGERCSRSHPRPVSSRTLLMRGFYGHFSLEQQRRDDYDADAQLETDERELRHHFDAFFWDALPELRRAGTVVQFKVCRNLEPHLRGNVYVQYASEEEATRALVMFNGRWYAGRQISCEFSPVQRWKSAICGLFFRNRCPKGRGCNFLHVFRNPTDEFRDADQDRESPRSQRQLRHPRSPPSSRERGSTSHRPDSSRRSSSTRGSRSPPSHRSSRESSRESRRSSRSERSKHSDSPERERRSHKHKKHHHKSHKSHKSSKKKKKSRSKTRSRSRSRPKTSSDTKSDFSTTLDVAVKPETMSDTETKTGSKAAAESTPPFISSGEESPGMGSASCRETGGDEASSTKFDD
ncbi:U2 small nuclear ribonucleoprotein auxiliary factor 35 kDa subunit-related protein 1 [Ixodes scapularis]